MNAEGLLIGLEIHVQLKSESKLFCSCRAGYQDAEPNVNVCPVCTGQPGSKPFSINERAVENMLKIAAALKAKVKTGESIHVRRKHYFYPDLPSGYQRTSLPIAENGMLGGVRIREVHLEEDPGRYELKKGLVDFNRSGTPLAEIVTEPDIRSPEEARRFLEELSAILEYLDAARSEAGSTRIDANISLAGGNRVEVKNINSFKGVLTALAYEMVRQKNLLSKGMSVQQETRHFEESQGITVGMRKKETADDYRYLPDPDIPPVCIEKALVERTAASMPELPRQKSERIARQFGIRDQDAWILVGEKEIADLFESLAKKYSAQKLAFWMRGPLKKQLNYRNLLLKQSGLGETQVVELLDLLFSEKITEKTSDDLLIRLLDGKIASPFKTAEAEGLLKISGEGELEKVVDAILKENPKAIEDYRAGGAKAFNFLSGKAMAKTKGRADPSKVSELLRKKLG